jgi:heme-degrading monooxygenase HmoA
MADAYASAQWFVREGEEEVFVQRWHDFLTWTQGKFGDGFERARLLRDSNDATHFVSFAEWDDAVSRDRWRQDAEFSEHLDGLRELCRDLHTSNYDQASRVG